MKIKYVKGDLFDMIVPNTVIPHVCNNANKWGRGFVVPLMNKYLYARTEFDEWAKGNRRILPYGLGYTQVVEVEPYVWVANMIAQVFYVHDGSIRQHRPLYYNKLADCMEQVAKHCKVHSVDILAPKFGSELAGGNWKFVEDLIYDIWIEVGIPVTVVEYNK